MAPTLPYNDVSGRNAHVFVRTAVIEQPTASQPHHSLDEHHVRYLTGFLPRCFGREDRSVGARQHAAWIGAVEPDDAGAVDEAVVGAVVDEHDIASRHYRR